MAPSSRWVSGGCGSRRGGYHRRPQQTYRRTTPAAPKPAKQAAAAAPKSLAGLSMGKPGTGSDPADKRPSRFRPAPTQAFNIIYERALEQRFFVLSRTRTGTDHCPEEVVEITGSTGNIYNVYIRQAPRCTCPHSMKGNQCKHILYVMARVLRARFDLVYQLGFLKEELREMFENAPPIEVSDQNSDETEAVHDKNRKPIEGDCPICFSALVDEASGSWEADVVYCRAQCGQNLHKECFEIWARTKRSSTRDHVTCPMCRAPWQGDDLTVASIKDSGILTDEGYVNVADQLGISTGRDTSTYYTGYRSGYGGW